VSVSVSNFTENPMQLPDFHAEFAVQKFHYLETGPGMKDTLRPNHRGRKATNPPLKDRRPSPGAAAAAQAAAARQVTHELDPNQDPAYPVLQWSEKAVTSNSKPLSALPVAQPQTVPRKPMSAAPKKPNPIVTPTQARRSSQQGLLPGRILSLDRQRIWVIHQNEMGRCDPEAIGSVPCPRDRAASTATEHKRPLSRSSSILNMFSQANMGGSTTARGSSPSSSDQRRSSLREVMKVAGRKLSGSLRKNVDIISMDPKERDGFIIDRNREAAPQAEEQQETGPPDTTFNGISGSGESDSSNSGKREHRKSRMYEHLDGEAGTNAPVPGPGPEMFNSGRKSVKPRFTAGEKVSIVLSKMTDPVKPRPRSNSAESEMSFADRAPPGYMHVCKRCHKEAQQFIHKSTGMCDKCHRQDVERLYEEQNANKIGKLGFR